MKPINNNTQLSLNDKYIEENMVLQEKKLKNGKTIKFEETPYYFKVTVDKRTWYWIRETGEYDGTSFKVAED